MLGLCRYISFPTLYSMEMSSNEYAIMSQLVINGANNRVLEEKSGAIRCRPPIGHKKIQCHEFSAQPGFARYEGQDI